MDSSCNNAILSPQLARGERENKRPKTGPPAACSVGPPSQLSLHVLHPNNAVEAASSSDTSKSLDNRVCGDNESIAPRLVEVEVHLSTVTHTSLGATMLSLMTTLTRYLGLVMTTFSETVKCTTTALFQLWW
jgi:hypothetical protein